MVEKRWQLLVEQGPEVASKSGSGKPTIALPGVPSTRAKCNSRVGCELAATSGTSEQSAVLRLVSATAELAVALQPLSHAASIQQNTHFYVFSS